MIVQSMERIQYGIKNWAPLDSGSVMKNRNNMQFYIIRSADLRSKGVKNTLKAFDDFNNKQKSVWSNDFLYEKKKKNSEIVFNKIKHKC